MIETEKCVNLNFRWNPEIKKERKRESERGVRQR